MSGRDVAEVVLTALALLVVASSAVGMLVARNVFVRLHFLTPVTSVAVPLFGVAVILDAGWGITAGLVILVVALLVVSGPVLQAATGRAAAQLGGIVSEKSPE